MSGKHKITIEDVARHAGVGIATVSRAINDSPGISLATKARIIQVIKELGFVPNSAAQSLKVRLTRQIALALPDIRNAFFPEVAWSVDQVARQHGYQVVQINTQANPQTEMDVIRQLKKLHVDGMIILPLAYPKGLKDVIAKSPFPISIMNYGKKLEDDYKADLVSLATQEGVLIMEHLRQIGRQRIAYAGVHKDALIEERYLAYERGVERLDPTLIFFGEDFSIQTGRQAANYFHGLEKMPDAIYAGNDMIAIGLINRLNELGVRIPEQIAIVGVDDIIWCTITEPRISSVSIMGVEVARAATELLLKRIKEQIKGEYERVKFQPRLVVRESSVKSFSTSPSPSE